MVRDLCEWKRHVSGTGVDVEVAGRKEGGMESSWGCQSPTGPVHYSPHPLKNATTSVPPAANARSLQKLSIETAV